MKQSLENQDDTRIISYVETQHSSPVQQSVEARTCTYSKVCARTRTMLELGVKLLRTVFPVSRAVYSYKVFMYAHSFIHSHVFPETRIFNSQWGEATTPVTTACPEEDR